MAKKARAFESLCDAIENGTVANVRQLLAAGADPNEIEEAGDVTPLMFAAIRGDLEIITALVDAGANVNAMAEGVNGPEDEFEFLDEAFQLAELHGMTALVYAVLYRHAKAKKYLSQRTNP